MLIWYENGLKENNGKGEGYMVRTFQVRSSRQIEFIDITREIREIVDKEGVREGFCIIFVPHTTGAVTINENADPSVTNDIIMELNKIVPFENHYKHLEGNSPAHVKASLIGCSKTVLIESGKLVLGVWQGIFFCEFDGPRNRKIHVKVIKTEK